MAKMMNGLRFSMKVNQLAKLTWNQSLLLMIASRSKLSSIVFWTKKRKSSKSWKQSYRLFKPNQKKRSKKKKLYSSNLKPKVKKITTICWRKRMNYKANSLTKRKKLKLSKTGQRNKKIQRLYLSWIFKKNLMKPMFNEKPSSIRTNLTFKN